MIFDERQVGKLWMSLSAKENVVQGWFNIKACPQADIQPELFATDQGRIDVTRKECIFDGLSG